MKWADIKPGVEVYHSIYTHHGKGVVEEIAIADVLELIFERGGPRRVVVNWSDGSRTRTQRVACLRKTPNRKKIKEMVAFYARRGKQAGDGGDRLILPKKDEAVP